jgi:acyl-CoA thioester hydrolase
VYVTEIEPRVSETDGAGHINNTTIPVWLEAGRHELFKLFTPDLSFEDWKMVIVKTTLEYKKQIYFGEKVEVKMWIKRIGNSSLELYEEIHQKGMLCAKNEAVYVNFNLHTQQTESIPEKIKAELEEHLWPERE